MGFFGTLVLARPAGLLVHEDAVLGFGYQHEHLWELDDGWQFLETRRIGDPPDFTTAGARFVAGTGGPVLSVYVNDGYCFGGYAATPDGWASFFHLPTDMAPCIYLHRPKPRARTQEDVAEDLERWARVVGLTPSPAKIRALAAFEVGTAPERGSEFAQVLLPALGVPGRGVWHPTVIDVDEEPWCSVIGFLGAARQAHNRRVQRESGDPDAAEQPWERAAIELEVEIWALRHRPDTDIAKLRGRAEQLCSAYMTAEQRRLPRWRT